MDYAQSRFVLGTTGCELNGLILQKFGMNEFCKRILIQHSQKKGVTFALRLDSVFPITTG